MFYPIGFGGHHFFLYLIVPAILGIWAQIRVTGAFNRWGKVRASSNITGAECAREILQAAQIHDVDVVETNDFLGDHYDPTNKKLCLSSNVYNTPSVAALGIAAHETGHAIQHAKAYAPLKARMAIVPLQDFLGLDSEARMNTPSLSDGNWGWRFKKSAITNTLAEKLATLSVVSDRNPLALSAHQQGDGEVREDFAA